MAAASWQQPCIFCGMRRYGDTEIRRYAGGLLKESPEPPRTFLKLYLAEAGWWGGRIPRRRRRRAWGNRFSLPPLSRRPVGRLPTLPLVCFLAPYPPHPRSQSALPRWGRGETKVIFMQGASPLASPGAGRDAALKVGGMRRPAGACPGRHGQVNSGSPNPAEAAKPILQHPTSQPPCRSAGEGRNRARTPDPINHNLFGKVLGGLGDSFKSPPALPRAPPRSPALPRASPSPPPRFNAEKQAQEAVFFRRL